MPRYEIMAKDARMDDVYVDNSDQNWMIRSVFPQGDDHVRLRLAAGRSDRAVLELFGAEEIITIWRPEEES